MNLRDQLFKLKSVIVILFLVGFTFMASVFILSLIQSRPLMQYTADPANIFYKSPAIGFISRLGNLLWSAAASITLFSSVLIYDDNGSSSWWLFLGASGLLGLLFMLDDTLQLHESVFPKFYVPENIILILYVFIVGRLTFRGPKHASFMSQNMQQ